MITKINDYLELLGLNLIGTLAVVLNFLSLSVFSTIVAITVGLSVLVLNVFKIYVYWRDKVKK